STEKLCGCNVVSLKVEGIALHGYTMERPPETQAPRTSSRTLIASKKSERNRRPRRAIRQLEHIRF
ncbi:MAG TPA: hypothetical protein VEK14_00095, partial [Rhodomicrobium sp.]|nr:hypothetical protein [Rhodomicrobium sp.]